MPGDEQLGRVYHADFLHGTPNSSWKKGGWKEFLNSKKKKSVTQIKSMERERTKKWWYEPSNQTVRSSYGSEVGWRPFEDMSQDFSVWGDKETIQQNPVDLYMKGQAISREKALSQVLGQWWFHHTNCQLTEKVSGCLFPNWYQENCLLMTHLFVYENIFVMILWTVPQSHPFPQSAIQLCSCQEMLMGTLNSCLLQDVADMSSTRILVSGRCWQPRYFFRWKAPNARTGQVNLNQILYHFYLDANLLRNKYATRTTS